MRPRPSDDPVMNTRATSHLLSSRRPFRLTIPNSLPPSRVFPCTRHDAGERVYTIQEEEGRPEEEHLQHRFRAETEIYFTTQQKADAASITSLPGVLASRLVDCPAISSASSARSSHGPGQVS